jgi:transcriptional regulator GlxA family with amidase domain
MTSASWVDLAEFQQLYPALKLADELVVQGGEMLCAASSTTTGDEE